MRRMSRRRRRAVIWRKLADGGLLSAEKQGRHRYYRLASPLVGQMLEGVMAVAGPEPPRSTTWRGGEALRTARTCYDHLAGRLGVALADALSARGPCRAGHRWRRSDRAGGTVPRRLRRIARAGATGILPAVPGLERASAASRRAGGRGAGVPVLRTRLDRAAARHAGGGDHHGGAPGVPADLRVRDRRLATRRLTGVSIAAPREDGAWDERFATGRHASDGSSSGRIDRSRRTLITDPRIANAALVSHPVRSLS